VAELVQIASIHGSAVGGTEGVMADVTVPASITTMKALTPIIIIIATAAAAVVTEEVGVVDAMADTITSLTPLVRLRRTCTTLLLPRGQPSLSYSIALTMRNKLLAPPPCATTTPPANIPIRLRRSLHLHLALPGGGVADVVVSVGDAEEAIMPSLATSLLLLTMAGRTILLITVAHTLLPHLRRSEGLLVAGEVSPEAPDLTEKEQEEDQLT